MTKNFKQKRAADAFAKKQRSKGAFASVFEEPVDPNSNTRRARARMRYYVEYDKGSSLTNPARKRVSLKNFTGTITKNANGTVSIKGRNK